MRDNTYIKVMLGKKAPPCEKYDLRRTKAEGKRKWRFDAHGKRVTQENSEVGPLFLSLHPESGVMNFVHLE